MAYQVEVSKEVSMEKDQIVRLARSGDPDGMNELVREYHKSVFCFVFSRIQSRVEAEDLTQEVFLRVCKHISNLEDVEGFHKWLFTIAENVVNSHCAGQKRKKEVESTIPNVEASRDYDPADPAEVEKQRLLARMREILAKIPEIYRVPYVMNVGEGMTMEVIASVLDVPLNTIRSRIARAKVAIFKLRDEK